jgi:hypothetical protein
VEAETRICLALLLPGSKIHSSALSPRIAVMAMRPVIRHQSGRVVATPGFENTRSASPPATGADHSSHGLPLSVTGTPGTLGVRM